MTAVARVSRSCDAYFGLAKKVRSPGPACSIPATRVDLEIAVALEAAPEALCQLCERQMLGSIKPNAAGPKPAPARVTGVAVRWKKLARCSRCSVAATASTRSARASGATATIARSAESGALGSGVPLHLRETLPGARGPRGSARRCGRRSSTRRCWAREAASAPPRRSARGCRSPARIDGARSRARSIRRRISIAVRRGQIVGIDQPRLGPAAQLPQQPLLGDRFRDPAQRACLDACDMNPARRPRRSTGPRRRSRSASASISRKRCARRRNTPDGGSLRRRRQLVRLLAIQLVPLRRRPAPGRRPSCRPLTACSLR